MTNKQFRKIVDKAREGNIGAFMPFYEEFLPILLKQLVEEKEDTTLVNNIAKEVIWKVYQKYVTDEIEPVPTTATVKEEVVGMIDSLKKDNRKIVFIKAWSKLSDDCKVALTGYNPSNSSKNISKCLEQFKDNF